MKIICIFIMFYTVRLWLWDKQKVCKNVQSKINGQNNPPPQNKSTLGHRSTCSWRNTLLHLPNASLKLQASVIPSKTEHIISSSQWLEQLQLNVVLRKCVWLTMIFRWHSVLNTNITQRYLQGERILIANGREWCGPFLKSRQERWRYI